MFNWIVMPGFLFHTWPWYVAGPLIGLFVPLLSLLGNRRLGISGNLRHLCAAVAPARLPLFRYDWKRAGAWNLMFVLGAGAGGFIGVYLLGTHDIGISPATRQSLAALGLHDFSGLVPREMISWHALLTVKGFISIVAGGFMVGFGTAWAGGCTSGHAISGLSNFEFPSLLAVVGFFAGGLAGTHFLLPLLFSLP